MEKRKKQTIIRRSLQRRRLKYKHKNIKTNIQSARQFYDIHIDEANDWPKVLMRTFHDVAVDDTTHQIKLNSRETKIYGILEFLFTFHILFLSTKLIILKQIGRFKVLSS